MLKCNCPNLGMCSLTKEVNKRTAKQQHHRVMFHFLAVQGTFIAFQGYTFFRLCYVPVLWEDSSLSYSYCIESNLLAALKMDAERRAFCQETQGHL